MAIHSLPWNVPGNIKACYSSRAGGLSLSPYDSFNLAQHVGDDPEAVTSNREIMASRFPDVKQWQWLDQVHGTEVLLVEEGGSQQGEVEADAIVCRVSGVACCVMTADCLPVFFADKRGGEVAIAHAGWRGLANGIIERTLSSMTTPREDIVAFLGPAIGPCHFEVGAEVLEYFLDKTPIGSTSEDTINCFKPAPPAEKNKYLADLYALANLRLKAMGVQVISGGDQCTYCKGEDFYSFRRDGVTGRMLGMIYFD